VEIKIIAEDHKDSLQEPKIETKFITFSYKHGYDIYIHTHKIGTKGKGEQ